MIIVSNVTIIMKSAVAEQAFLTCQSVCEVFLLHCFHLSPKEGRKQVYHPLLHIVNLRFQEVGWPPKVKPAQINGQKVHELPRFVLVVLLSSSATSFLGNMVLMQSTADQEGKRGSEAEMLSLGLHESLDMRCHRFRRCPFRLKLYPVMLYQI